MVFVLNDLIRLHDRPAPKRPRLIIGLSGWMDAGEISTGTIDHLVDATEAEFFAELHTPQSYVQHFPGGMEVEALFRPHVVISNGVIEEFIETQNYFYYSKSKELLFFSGKEPHLHWRPYAEALLSVVQYYRVETVYCVGSVSGMIPHTRPPLFHTTVSEEGLLPWVTKHGLLPSNYEGPGSFVTYLTTLAAQRGVPLLTVVAETPAYIEGSNPIGINATIDKLAALLDVLFAKGDLEEDARAFQAHLETLLERRPALREQLADLEAQYDQEVGGESEANRRQADLKDVEAWFNRQDIDLD